MMEVKLSSKTELRSTTTEDDSVKVFVDGKLIYQNLPANATLIWDALLYVVQCMPVGESLTINSKTKCRYRKTRKPGYVSQVEIHKLPYQKGWQYSYLLPDDKAMHLAHGINKLVNFFSDVEEQEDICANLLNIMSKGRFVSHPLSTDQFRD